MDTVGYRCSVCGDTRGWKGVYGGRRVICARGACRGYYIPYAPRADGDSTEFAPDAKDTNPKDAIGATKVPLSLFPSTAIVAGAMAFLEGAVKYGRYNWRIAGVRASIYKDAMDRHLHKWWNGEDIDPDSGLPHLWKALACIAILIDAGEAGKLTDDRPPSIDAAGMIERLTAQVEEIKERYADRSPKQYTITDTQEV